MPASEHESSSATPGPGAAAGLRVPLLSAAVLLATDGGSDAAGAVAFAAALARLRGAIVYPVTVLKPPAYPVASMEPVTAGAADPVADDAVETRVRAEVGRQLGELFAEHPSSQAAFTRGRVVPTIVREALARNAGLIVLGLHEHDLFDRIAGEETALRVVRAGVIPVAAIVPTTRRLPRRIVVAMDFGPACVRAAHQALALVEGDATVVIANVRPPVAARRTTESAAHYALGVGSALEQVQQSLPASARITVETVTLEGETVPQLLSLAARSECDLIALGSHRHSFVGRLLLGSVATDLIRAASVSLLIAAPEDDQPVG